MNRSATTSLAAPMVITARRSGLPWVPILMYHRVLPNEESPRQGDLCVSVAEFSAQMRFLKRHGYHAVSLEEMASSNRLGDGKRVAITFDDGYRDTFLHALPVLQKDGLTATVFLVTDFLGGVNAWDRGKFAEAALLGVGEVREMQRCGITFGCHSASHRSLPGLEPGDAWAEIAVAKAALEQALGTGVQMFSYPFGRSDVLTRDMVKRAGYAAACGIEQREHSLFNMSRVDAARCRGADLLWHWKVSGLAYRLRAHPVARRFRAVRKLGNWWWS